MVPFGLVGVSFREVGDRPVEALAVAEVAGDLQAVAGAGVRPGQRAATQAGIDNQFIGRRVRRRSQGWQGPRAESLALVTRRSLLRFWFRFAIYLRGR